MSIKLRIVGRNQTEIRIGEKLLFFSYDTLVAVYKDGYCYRTDAKYSKTTTKHLNDWCPSTCILVTPEELAQKAEG